MSLFPLLLLSVALLATIFSFANADSTMPLWPIPSSVSIGAGNSVTLNKDFSFKLASNFNNVLATSAIDRYSSLIGTSVSNTGTLHSCSLSVDSTVIPEIIGADETYTVSVSSDGACEIHAVNLWGLLHGLETFSQLLVRDTDASTVLLRHTPVSVKDSSRYRHRGILIDTSRHYISVEQIKRVIDSLPTNKFNVLHWHVVDAESFPLDTPSEPSLIKGAYTPRMIYSMDTLSELKDYAFTRGVEIILEIDIPGHAAAWAAGKKEIMADCFVKYSYNINDFALNPALEETYTTIDNILGDVTQALGSSRIHLGGDEVVYGCWRNDTSVVNFYNSKGYTSYDQLLSYFVGRVDDLALQKHKQSFVTHWEEVFSAGYKPTNPQRTLFQVWTDSSMISALTAAGYNLIASPSNYWYLNIATNTWSSMYDYDPTMDIPTQQQGYIFGGETALWGEYVDDNNIESSLYPRAASVGERLWSSKSQAVDSASALPRLLIQRCRMVNRGIRAAPVQPDGYCDEVYV